MSTLSHGIKLGLGKAAGTVRRFGEIVTEEERQKALERRSEEKEGRERTRKGKAVKDFYEKYKTLRTPEEMADENIGADLLTGREPAPLTPEEEAAPLAGAAPAEEILTEKTLLPEGAPTPEKEIRVPQPVLAEEAPLPKEPVNIKEAAMAAAEEKAPKVKRAALSDDEAFMAAMSEYPEGAEEYQKMFLSSPERLLKLAKAGLTEEQTETEGAKRNAVISNIMSRTNLNAVEAEKLGVDMGLIKEKTLTEGAMREPTVALTEAKGRKTGAEANVIEKMGVTGAAATALGKLLSGYGAYNVGASLGSGLANPKSNAYAALKDETDKALALAGSKTATPEQRDQATNLVKGLADLKTMATSAKDDEQIISHFADPKVRVNYTDATNRRIDELVNILIMQNKMDMTGGKAGVSGAVRGPAGMMRLTPEEQETINLIMQQILIQMGTGE
jgi:hypothetical protein